MHIWWYMWDSGIFIFGSDDFWSLNLEALMRLMAAPLPWPCDVPDFSACGRWPSASPPRCTPGTGQWDGWNPVTLKSRQNHPDSAECANAIKIQHHSKPSGAHRSHSNPWNKTKTYGDFLNLGTFKPMVSPWNKTILDDKLGAQVRRLSISFQDGSLDLLKIFLLVDKLNPLMEKGWLPSGNLT